jgi:hypothetical protein
MPIISPVAISPLRALRKGQSWLAYWTTRCPEYMAVYNMFATKPSQPIATLQAEMLYAIGQAGAWSILDWFVCLAGESEPESRLDWKSLIKTVDDVGTGNAWTALSGIKGNGSGYLDSNFIPSTDGAHIGLDDACYGFYTNLDIAGADQMELTGRTGTTDGVAMYSRFTDGKSYVKIHTSGAYLNTAVATRKGCYIANRVVVDNTQLWKDNIKIIDTGQSSNVNPPNASIKLLASPTGASRSLNQISFAFAGKGLSEAQIAAITTALQTYMDKLFFLDDFDDATLDTDKWIVTNPDADVASFSQNKALIMDTLFVNNLNTLANNVACARAITNGVARFTLIDLNNRAEAIREVGLKTADNLNRIHFYRKAAQGNLYFEIIKNNVSVYEVDTGVYDYAIFKIVISGGFITLYRWLNSWVQIGDAQEQYLMSLYFYMATRGYDGAKTLLSDFYMTKDDYATLYPTL